MELSRLLRLAQARWWLIGILAGVGLVAGVVLTSYRNSQIQPQFESTTTVLFSFEDDDDRQRGLQGLVAEAQSAAEEANVEVIGPLAFVRVDPEDIGALQFVGRARTEEEAEFTALLLRDNYVAFTQDLASSDESQAQADLDRLDGQLTIIEAEINDLNEELSADPELVDQRVQLEADLAVYTGIRSQLLEEDLLGPNTNPNDEDPRTAEDVDADLAVTEAKITQIEAEIEVLDVPSGAELTAASRQLEIRTDQRSQLLDQYIALLLAPQAEEAYTFGITATTDNTPQAASPILNGLLGMVLGGLAALGLTIALDRTRRTVWVGSDLPTVPLLGEVPARGPLRVAGQIWYELGGPPQRRRAVQAMRVTIESGVAGARAAVGFAGVGTPSADIHAVAADFGMSMATSGNRVLLIDADFDNPSGLAEFEGPGPTFSEILQHSLDDEESFRSYVKRAVTEPSEIRPGLMSMRVGEGLADPADALASRRFSILLEEVGAIYDMTIVAVGDGRETTTQTVLNRLDHVIFAIRPGRTSASEVEALQAQLNTFGVSVMGAALVLQAGKSPETSLPVGPESEPPSQTRRPRDEEDPADALVEALVRERERSIKRSGGDRPPAAPKSASIRPVDTPRVEALPAPVEVAESPLPTVAPIETVAPAPMPLLATLSPTTSDEISDQVAVLLETTIDHVLRGFTGVAGTQRFDPGIREVTKYGFVPLVRVKGHKTLGARVFEALKADLDDDGKRQLQSELVDYFDIEPGGRTNERIAGSINRWTAEHYFTRHLAATGREPEVWHVSSPAGTFQALTHSSRATKERIDLLRSEILRRQLDTLNRTLKSAVKAKRSSQVRHLEEQIKDIRTFDIALGWLFEGTTPNARIWYPWKSPEQQPQGWDPNLDEGIRANVAPLQRLGLLVCDVLTEEELIALSPPS